MGGNLPPQRKTAGESPFAGMFREAVDRVEQFRAGANQQVSALLSGESDDIHSTIMATQKAELSFELFLQVRNKVVQAYQEVMRQQI
jgi:flagellar hook-basal body complex protein FliE